MSDFRQKLIFHCRKQKGCRHCLVRDICKLIDPWKFPKEMNDYEIREFERRVKYRKEEMDALFSDLIGE